MSKSKTKKKGRVMWGCGIHGCSRRLSRPIYTCEVNNDFLQTLLDALRHRVGRMV